MTTVTPKRNGLQPIKFLSLTLLALGMGLVWGTAAQAITVAQWTFPTGPSTPVTSFNWLATGGTQSGSANLEGYIGNPEKDDEQNLSATSNRLTWLDLKGGGDDWEDPRTGSPTVVVDKAGTIDPNYDFGNDALIYITLDGTGLSNFAISIEAVLDSDPEDHVTSMDFFYRVSTSNDTWYRPADMNNVGWTTTSGNGASLTNFSLPTALAGQPNIELVIADFAEGDGNNFLAIGPLTIAAVPEPSTAIMVGLGLVGLAAVGRRQNA